MIIFGKLQVNKLDETASCIATHQLLLPDDPQMKDNKNYFLEEEGLSLDLFVPREEALRYFNRDRYEKHLLDYINEQFVFDDEDQMDIFSTIEDNEEEEEKTLESLVCIYKNFTVLIFN